MSELVIPDSIEPFIGYKALVIRPDMLLSSPSYETIWPVGKRLEAKCAKPVTIRWIKKEGTDPAFLPSLRTRGSAHHHGRQARGDVVLWTNTTSLISDLHFPPMEELPEGYHWSWEEVEHTVAEAGCSCGIYVVQDLKNTFSYMQRNAVVCEIALWGQTTVANRGARGQYAYPQKMYVPEHLERMASAVAELYQIPVEKQKFVTGYEPHIISQRARQMADLQRSAQAKRDARRSAWFFFAISLINAALAATAAARGRGWALVAFPLILAFLTACLSFVCALDAEKE